MKSTAALLEIDPKVEVERISNFIKEQTSLLRREGAVIGLSGGVDSAVSAELCARALGKEKVLGLILPERESNPISKDYAIKQAHKMGIAIEVLDITPVLEAFGTYAKRDSVIKQLFPGYRERCRLKIVLPGDILSRDTLNFFTLLIEDEKGEAHSFRLKKEALNAIVAATDTKQRTRMMHLYYFAEKMNFLVCGATNRSEMMQGYFVKYGDGGVDIEPIAHLYKTQVFELARYLGVNEEILKRIPSPDTFS
ncbi:MAG: NAD(+) synthase, partial [Candidatus Aminicenantales bacterium]